MTSGTIFNAAWLASQTPAERTRILQGLPAETIAALPWLWRFWARPDQLPPQGEWTSWIMLGGRGAGKTRAGAEWVRASVAGRTPLSAGARGRLALVGETLAAARDVMVEGESGILACSPPDRRPEWQAGRKRLVWPNGAVAQVFSAHEPEALRGPQFDAAWVDELAKWKKGQDTWDTLQFGLRLGVNPQQVVTTTPKNVGVLRNLLDAPSTVSTHAPTEANRAYLAASFLEEVRTRYGGTRQGRQELDGLMLEDAEGALWSTAQLEAGRVKELPAFDRVVVAVDPPVTGHAGSDACGIVVVGVTTQGAPQDWRAVVIEDASVVASSPSAWAEAAIDALRRHGGDRLVAEVNQGGDLVESVLRQIDPMIPYRAVRASRGKIARAEPVAALYEQGRIAHAAGLGELEDQMCQMTPQGYQGQGSPDRLDALVWALHDLIIQPAASLRMPQVRVF